MQKPTAARPWTAWVVAAALPLIALAGTWYALRGRPASDTPAPAATPAAPRPAAAAVDPAQLDGARALQEVTNFVALGPRVSGSENAQKAAMYIAGRLKDMGIDPSYDIFVDDTPSGQITFRNVIGTIEGTSRETVLLMSHFDTKKGISDTFVGANDSGSSTGLLLEIARVLRERQPLPVTVQVAFLDGEECQVEYGTRDGLHGSYRLATRLEALKVKGPIPVKAAILLDMVGDKDLSVTIPLNSTPKLAGLILQAAHEEHARDSFRILDSSILDDHVPILKLGIPAVDIIDFEYGSAPGMNDYWHTPADTVDKLSAESLQTVGRVVLQAVNKLMVPVDLTTPPPAPKPRQSQPPRRPAAAKGR